MPPPLAHKVQLSFDLVNDNDEVKQRDVTLSEDTPVRVGRASKDRSKQLNPNHDNLFLSNSVVSRKHAEFTYQPGGGPPHKYTVFIDDLQSTHGTFLNATQVCPGAKQEVKSGDRVQFGTTVDRETEVYPPPIFRVQITEMDTDIPFNGTYIPLGKSYGVPDDEEDFYEDEETGYDSDSPGNNVDEDNDEYPYLDDYEDDFVVHAPDHVPPPQHQIAWNLENDRPNPYIDILGLPPLPSSPVPPRLDDISSGQPSSSIPPSPERVRSGPSPYLQTVLVNPNFDLLNDSIVLPNETKNTHLSGTNFYVEPSTLQESSRKRKFESLDEEGEGNEPVEAPQSPKLKPALPIPAMVVDLADQLKEPQQPQPEPQPAQSESQPAQPVKSQSDDSKETEQQVEKVVNNKERPTKRARMSSVALGVTCFLAGSVSTIYSLSRLPEGFF